MRVLAYLLMFLLVGSAVAQSPTILQGNYISNVFGNSNFVLNPNAQTSTANVTVSSATVTRSTTTPLVATTEFLITTSTATGSATWSTRTFDSGMKGQNCEARFSYRGFSVGSTTAQILQGANVVAQLTLTPSTDPRIASINFPCGDLSSATTFRLQQATASLTGTNEIGGIYVGLATNMANVAQAEIVVSAYKDSAQSIGATETTIVYNQKTYDQYGEFNTSTGVFTAKRAGRYEISASFIWDTASFTSGNTSEILLFKNTTRIASGFDTQQATLSRYWQFRTNGVIDLAVGDTLEVKTYTNSGTNKNIYTGTFANTYNQFIIKRFPSSSELVVTPERQNVFGGVQYRGAGGGIGNSLHFGATAPTTYSTYNNAMWNQPTMLKGRAQLATTSSNDLGFSIPNLPVGNYEVIASGFMVPNNGAGAAAGSRVRCNFRVRETTTNTTVSQQTVQNYVVTAGAGVADIRNYPNSFTGVFTNTSVGTRNFVLQAQKYTDSAGTAGNCEVWSDDTSNSLNTDITIMLKPLDQPSNSALYVQGPVKGSNTNTAIPTDSIGGKVIEANINRTTTTLLNFQVGTGNFGTPPAGTYLVLFRSQGAPVAGGTAFSGLVSESNSSTSPTVCQTNGILNSTITTFSYDTCYYTTDGTKTLYSWHLAAGANTAIDNYVKLIRLN